MKTSDRLEIGNVYTREDLRRMFSIVDATINTGVFRPKGHDSVWLFVTERKTPDRTQYSDYFDGNRLEWDGQTSGRTDDWIVNHGGRGLELLLFYRKEKYEFPGAGFRYYGPLAYRSHLSRNPTHFILQVVDDAEMTVLQDVESIANEEEYFEGRKQQRFSAYYERNPQLRLAAIRIHGLTCAVCGFDYEKAYGRRGKGYIEVHHLKPVSSLSQPEGVDPKRDMAVLCSNCHRMIHRRKDDILSLNQLREAMKNR
jgi:5-methylcytosine-specific restriction endonuclease McrA